MVYIYGILGVLLFRENDPRNFRNLGKVGWCRLKPVFTRNKTSLVIACLINAGVCCSVILSRDILMKAPGFSS